MVIVLLIIFQLNKKREKHTHTPTYNPTKEHTHKKHVAYVLCVALEKYFIIL